MEKGLLHLHSSLRYVILVLLIGAIYVAFSKNSNAKKISLPLLISSHIMLLIGIYQWFWGTYGWTKTLPEGTSIMKNKVLRFFMVEHPLMMIIAILLITLGHSNIKVGKYKKSGILFGIALILIIAAVPWPFREALGRGWLPR